VRARAEEIGAPVTDTYGLSETWGGVVLDGRPIPGVEIRLGPDDEIEMRGPMIMRGYRDAPEATADVFTADGWFRTGDVGVIESGRVHVVDRARDLVITGGVNVSPTAVEAVLATHPLIEDVCVAGAPDAEWGERVVAYVVPTAPGDTPTLDDLRAFARDRLSAAQLPKQLVLLDAIPRTPGGKALRRELRAPEPSPG
jgi:O-succinylbenzoic acid--CoA ligase